MYKDTGPTCGSLRLFQYGIYLMALVDTHATRVIVEHDLEHGMPNPEFVMPMVYD